MNTARLVGLTLLMLLFSGCVATRVTPPGFRGYRADVSSKPGQDFGFTNGNIRTIGAGYAKIGDNSYWNAWYLIDKTTGTCWFKVGASMQALDCCKLRKIETAHKYIRFEKLCDGDGTP